MEKQQKGVSVSAHLLRVQYRILRLKQQGHQAMTTEVFSLVALQRDHRY